MKEGGGDALGDPEREADQVVRTRARHRGVVGLDLDVRAGEVCGFLGPNGAGKATIRVLLDLIRPSTGRAQVLGLDRRAESLAIRRRSGYLPGELAVYRRLTGEETLRFFANLRGGVEWSYVRGLVERLAFDLTKRVADLSTGNKRKLGLIQAFMHKPELLILDEPTVGLDPLVQRVCDRVAFIREGEFVAVEDVAELTGRAVREVEVVFATPVEAAGVPGVSGVSGVNANGHGLRLTVAGSLDALVKRLAQYEVVTMTSRAPDLEDVFLALYGERIGHVA